MAKKGNDSGSQDSSRVRATLSKVDQEDHIIRLMLAGRWYGGRTSEELAKEWGIHPRTVADRALVASGVIHRRGGPVEDFIDRKLSELDALQAAAMNEVKWYVVKGELVSKPAHNVPAAVKAIELQAKMRGAIVHKHEHKDAPDMPEAEFREELRKYLTETESEGKDGMH